MTNIDGLTAPRAEEAANTPSELQRRSVWTEPNHARTDATPVVEVEAYPLAKL